MFGKNVSDQLIEMLTSIGVKQIFGIPGDTIDSMMESLRKQKEIEFIVMRHEETGAFAASGQAKLNGKLAVCAACQGPGAIHLLNGLYDAALDRVPVLAITGQVSTTLQGTGTVQEINQISLFEDVAVFNEEARSAEAIPELLTLACQAAINKKGVAHLSIPSDIMRDKAVKWSGKTAVFYPEYKIMPQQEPLIEAADILNKANKVSVLYGGGSANACEELVKLSEKLNAPLVHTTRSKDILDNYHANYVGGIGLMGSQSGNHAMQHCDALLIVGSSFAFKEFYPDNVPIIQIDEDATRLGLRTPITNALVGDSKLTLNALLELLNQKNDDKFLKDAQKVHKKSRAKQAKQVKTSKKNVPVHPQTLTEKIGELASEDAIFCMDSGSVGVWANNFLHLNGRQRLLWSWNLATLACSMPHAIGCQFVEPERQIVVLAGDGGFEMLIGDFATAVHYNLPIICIVYNNSTYRFIELEEAGEGNPAFGTKFTNPNYAKLAEAFGGAGYRIDDYEQLEPTLEKAFASRQPTIIDVCVNPNELIIPPKINAKMVTAFAESTIKSYFAKRVEA